MRKNTLHQSYDSVIKAIPKLIKQKKYLAVAIILGIGIVISQSPSLQDQVIVNAPAGQYRVLAVKDGDTIVVDIDGTDETIRFIGVDTPETHHPSKPVQCFGRAATNYTESNVGSFVRLETDPLSDNRDRYGRLLRYVYSDEQLINQSLIREGYGFAYRTFPHTLQTEFIAAEQSARQAERGLWSGCDVQLNEYGSYEAEPAT